MISVGEHAYKDEEVVAAMLIYDNLKGMGVITIPEEELEKIKNTQIAYAQG